MYMIGIAIDMINVNTFLLTIFPDMIENLFPDFLTEAAGPGWPIPN